MKTVNRNLDRPTLIQFNDWLKEKAEAHERMKATSSKHKTDDLHASAVTKTKTGTKVFAATSRNQVTTETKPKGDRHVWPAKTVIRFGVVQFSAAKLQQSELS